MDPAMRLAPAGLTLYPAGMEVALLIEHALGMAIEGSSLRAIGEQAGTGGPIRIRRRPSSTTRIDR